MTTKKTAKKTAKKKAKRTPARKKASKKTIRKKIATPSMAEFNGSPASPWPWPLRPYQQKAYNEFNAGRKRQLLAWHRRAGKDILAMSLIRDQVRKRVGSYVHMLPKFVQAKRAIWNGIDPKIGQRFINHAYGDMEVARNNSEMLIEMYNGGTYQLAGADSYDRIVGSNIVGVIFSEWALCDPRSWDYIRPMILENDGFAIFISTFRGRGNHMWQMCQALKDNPQWYVDIRSVEDTVDVDGNRIITDADIQAERDSGMSEALIQQEYYSDPQAISDGAIYGAQVERLRSDVPRQAAFWNPSKPVYSVWNFDLPIFASVLHVQAGDTPQILAAETFTGVSLGEAMSKSMRHRWPVQNHIISARHAELLPQLSDMDMRPEVVQEKSHLTVTTCAANFLDRCLIDYAACELLLDALSGYVRRERFDSQVADLQYADFPASSWHQQLADCLETWATWEYYSHGTNWSKAPDYANHDKIARTII